MNAHMQLPATLANLLQIANHSKPVGIITNVSIISKTRCRSYDICLAGKGSAAQTALAALAR